MGGEEQGEAKYVHCREQRNRAWSWGSGDQVCQVYTVYSVSVYSGDVIFLFPLARLSPAQSALVPRTFYQFGKRSL